MTGPNAPQTPAKPPKLPALRTLDGKYALLRELVTGGAGADYEAEDLTTGKTVAIMLPHGTMGVADETHRARFLGEARAAAEIGHENVTAIHDFGVSPDGAPYLVMDLLRGETLAELMARRGALSPAYACELMVQILAGLGAAHAVGIVHRALEPGTIVVTHPRPDSPLLKIRDFGVAAGVSGGPPANEGLLRTPLYLAPEQALGRAVDERADLYAAGVILYEMLAGETPFTASSRAELLRHVVAGQWRPLSNVNPAVPRALAAAVAAAMATDPRDRVSSAHAFAQKLAPYLSHPPPHSVPHGLYSSAAAFPLEGEGPLLSDAPGVSRPPRDFPSLDLAKIAGKPRGEPLSDSLLQSPIFPKAPGAAKIQLFDGARDLETWADAPPSRAEQAKGADEASTAERAPSQAHGARSSGALPEAESEGESRKKWSRPAWLAVFGVGVGAALAWLYRLG